MCAGLGRDLAKGGKMDLLLSTRAAAALSYKKSVTYGYT